VLQLTKASRILGIDSRSFEKFTLKNAEKLDKMEEILYILSRNYPIKANLGKPRDAKPEGLHPKRMVIAGLPKRVSESLLKIAELPKIKGSSALFFVKGPGGKLFKELYPRATVPTGR
jgi:hypothetical protein